MLAAAGTTPEEFVAGKVPEASARAVAAMIALATEHLSAYRNAASGMPHVLRPAYLPLAIVPAYLEKLARRPMDADQGAHELPAWKRHWLLFRSASKS